MLVTPLPMVTEVKPLHKPLQSEKAESPMIVTLSGMVIEVNPVQPRKAPSPMLVTLSGMAIEVKPLQPRKAPSPMLVTLPSSGITLVLHPTTSVFVAISIRQFSTE